jgi:hypothetical protein
LKEHKDFIVEFTTSNFPANHWKIEVPLFSYQRTGRSEIALRYRNSVPANFGVQACDLKSS